MIGNDDVLVLPNNTGADLGTISEMSNAVSKIFGSSAILLNLLVLRFLAISQLNAIGRFRHLMIMTSAIECLFGVITIVANPIIDVIEGTSALVFVHNGLNTSLWLEEVFLFLYLTMLCQSIVLPPLLFTIRYIQVCRVEFSRIHPRGLLFIGIFAKSIFIVHSALLIVSFIPSTHDYALLQGVVENIAQGRKAAFLAVRLSTLYNPQDVLIDKVISICTAIAVVFTVVVLLLSLVIMCYTMYKMMRQVSTSAKNKKVYRQIRVILIVQSAIPFLCLHIPFIVSFVGPLVGLESTASDYFPFLMSVPPAVNPLVILFSLSELRRRLFCQKPTSPAATTTAAPFASGKRMSMVV